MKFVTGANCITMSHNARFIAVGDPKIATYTPEGLPETFLKEKGQVKVYVLINGNYKILQTIEPDEFEKPMESYMPTNNDLGIGTGFGTAVKFNQDGTQLAILEFNKHRGAGERFGWIWIYNFRNGVFQSGVSYLNSIQDYPVSINSYILPSFDFISSGIFESFELVYGVVRMDTKNIAVFRNSVPQSTIYSLSESGWGISIGLEEKTEFFQGKKYNSMIATSYCFSSGNSIRIIQLSDNSETTWDPVNTLNGGEEFVGIIDCAMTHRYVVALCEIKIQNGDHIARYIFHDLMGSFASAPLKRLTKIDGLEYEAIEFSYNSSNLVNRWLQFNVDGKILVIRTGETFGVQTLFLYEDDYFIPLGGSMDITEQIHSVNGSRNGQYVAVTSGNSFSVKNTNGREWFNELGFDHSDVIQGANRQFHTYINTLFNRDYIWFMNPFIFGKKVNEIHPMIEQRTIVSYTSNRISRESAYRYQNFFIGGNIAWGTLSTLGFSEEDIINLYVQYNNFKKVSFPNTSDEFKNGNFALLAVYNPELFQKINFNINLNLGYYMSFKEMAKFLLEYSIQNPKVTYQWDTYSTYFKSQSQYIPHESILKRYSLYELIINPKLNVTGYSFTPVNGEYPKGQRDISIDTLVKQKTFTIVSLKQTIDLFELDPIESAEAATPEQKYTIYWLHKAIQGICKITPFTQDYKSFTEIYNLLVSENPNIIQQFIKRLENNAPMTLIQLHLLDSNFELNSWKYEEETNTITPVTISSEEYKDLYMEQIWQQIKEEGLSDKLTANSLYFFYVQNFNATQIFRYISIKHDEAKTKFESNQNKILYQDRYVEIFQTTKSNIQVMMEYLMDFYESKIGNPLSMSQLNRLGWSLTSVVEQIQFNGWEETIENQRNEEGQLFLPGGLFIEYKSSYQYPRLMNFFYTKLGLSSINDLLNIGFKKKDITSVYQEELRGYTVLERYRFDKIFFTLSYQNQTFDSVNLYLKPFEYLKQSILNSIVSLDDYIIENYFNEINDPADQELVLRTLIRDGILSIKDAIQGGLFSETLVVTTFNDLETTQLIEFLRSNKYELSELYPFFMALHLNVTEATLTGDETRKVYMIYVQSLYGIEELKTIFTLSDFIYNSYSYVQLKGFFTEQELSEYFDSKWQDLPNADLYAPIRYTVSNATQKLVEFDINSNLAFASNFNFSLGNITYEAMSSNPGSYVPNFEALQQYESDFGDPLPLSAVTSELEQSETGFATNILNPLEASIPAMLDAGIPFDTLRSNQLIPQSLLSTELSKTSLQSSNVIRADSLNQVALIRSDILVGGVTEAQLNSAGLTTDVITMEELLNADLMKSDIKIRTSALVVVGITTYDLVQTGFIDSIINNTVIPLDRIKSQQTRFIEDQSLSNVAILLKPLVDNGTISFDSLKQAGFINQSTFILTNETATVQQFISSRTFSFDLPFIQIQMKEFINQGINLRTLVPEDQEPFADPNTIFFERNDVKQYPTIGTILAAGFLVDSGSTSITVETLIKQGISLSQLIRQNLISEIENPTFSEVLATSISLSDLDSYLVSDSFLQTIQSAYDESQRNIVTVNVDSELADKKDQVLFTIFDSTSPTIGMDFNADTILDTSLNVDMITIRFVVDQKGVMDITNEIQQTQTQEPKFDLSIRFKDGTQVVWNPIEDNSITAIRTFIEYTESSNQLIQQYEWLLDREKSYSISSEIFNSHELTFSSIPVSILYNSSTKQTQYFLNQNQEVKREFVEYDLDALVTTLATDTTPVTTDSSSEWYDYSWSSANLSFMQYGAHSEYPNSSTLTVYFLAKINRFALANVDPDIKPSYTTAVLVPLSLKYDKRKKKLVLNRLGTNLIQLEEVSLFYAHIAEKLDGTITVFTNPVRQSVIVEYRLQLGTWSKVTTYTIPLADGSNIQDVPDRNRQISHIHYVKNSDKIIAIQGLETTNMLTIIDYKANPITATKVTYDDGSAVNPGYITHMNGMSIMNTDYYLRREFGVIEWIDHSSGTLTYRHIGNRVGGLTRLGPSSSIGSAIRHDGTTWAFLNREVTTGNEVGALNIYKLDESTNQWQFDSSFTGWTPAQHFFLRNSPYIDPETSELQISVTTVSEYVGETELSVIYELIPSYQIERTYTMMKLLIPYLFFRLGSDSEAQMEFIDNLPSITIEKDGDTIDLMPLQQLIPSNMTTDDQEITKRIIFDTIAQNNPSIIYYYVNDCFTVIPTRVSYTPLVDRMLIVANLNAFKQKTSLIKNTIQSETFFYVPNSIREDKQILDIRLDGTKYTIGTNVDYNTTLKVNDVSQVVSKDSFTTYNGTIQTVRGGILMYVMRKSPPILTRPNTNGALLLWNQVDGSFSDFWESNKRKVVSYNPFRSNDIELVLRDVVYGALDDNSNRDSLTIRLWIPKEDNTFYYADMTMSEVRTLIPGMVQEKMENARQSQDYIIQTDEISSVNNVIQFILIQDEQKYRLRSPFVYSWQSDIIIPNRFVLPQNTIRCANRSLIIKDVNHMAIDNGTILYSEQAETIGDIVNYSGTVIVDVEESISRGSNITFISYENPNSPSVELVLQYTTIVEENDFISKYSDSVTNTITTNIDQLYGLEDEIRYKFYDDVMIFLDEYVMVAPGVHSFSSANLSVLIEQNKNESARNWGDKYVLLHNLDKSDHIYTVDLTQTRDIVVNENVTVWIPLLQTRTTVEFVESNGNVISTFDNEIKCVESGVKWNVTAFSPGIFVQKVPLREFSHDPEFQESIILQNKFYPLTEMMQEYRIPNVLVEYTFDEIIEIPNAYSYFIDQEVEQILVDNGIPLGTLFENEVDFTRIARNPHTGDLNFSLEEINQFFVSKVGNISLSFLVDLEYPITSYLSDITVDTLSVWSEYFSIDSLIDGRASFSQIEDIHDVTERNILSRDYTNDLERWNTVILLAKEDNVADPVIMEETDNLTVLLPIYLNRFPDDLWNLLEYFPLSNITVDESQMIRALQIHNSIKEDVSLLQIHDANDMNVALLEHSVHTMTVPELYNESYFIDVSDQELYDAGYSAYRIAEFRQDPNVVDVLMANVKADIQNVSLSLQDLIQSYSRIQLYEANVDPISIKTIIENTVDYDITQSEYRFLPYLNLQIIDDRSYQVCRCVTNIGSALSMERLLMTNQLIDPNLKGITERELIEKASKKIFYLVIDNIQMYRREDELLEDYISDNPVYLLLNQSVWKSDSVDNTVIHFIKQSMSKEELYEQEYKDLTPLERKKRIVCLIKQQKQEVLLENRLVWNRSKSMFESLLQTQNDILQMGKDTYIFTGIPSDSPIRITVIDDSNVRVYSDNRKVISKQELQGFYGKYIVKIHGYFEPFYIQIWNENEQEWQNLLEIFYNSDVIGAQLNTSVISLKDFFDTNYEMIRSLTQQNLRDIWKISLYELIKEKQLLFKAEFTSFNSYSFFLHSYVSSLNVNKNTFILLHNESNEFDITSFSNNKNDQLLYLLNKMPGNYYLTIQNRVVSTITIDEELQSFNINNVPTQLNSEFEFDGRYRYKMVGI